VLSAQDQEEPLLKENPHRFVLFPLQYPAIWEMYKKHEGESRAVRALPTFFFYARKIRVPENDVRWLRATPVSSRRRRRRGTQPLRSFTYTRITRTHTHSRIHSLFRSLVLDGGGG
jgi:hypothetical protein